ncbi:N-acetylmuramoyl-L-alanine amidase [Dietzia sp. UCD-THP]|uniref:N-acetylmuramoyl-L-alanine amidase n=1 Tax=Dietzia sp. UCD-THP TaxID=1292020 RepID=UPI001EE679F0|nr:N-acetylmuramoyl-L-alanine amidase [Dietzia sp. UCD-THP]
MSTRRRPLYVSGRRRTLALAVAVAASVVTPLAVYGADHLAESGDDIATTAGSAVPTGTAEVALSDAPAAAGVDTDIAVGSAPVKEVTSETPFSMVGVTWKGYNPEAVAALRAKNPDGSWGPWYEAESVDDEGESATGSGGTEPVFLGVDTTTVQIKVSGVDIADTSLADAPESAESDATGTEDAETQSSETRSSEIEEVPAQDDIAATRSAEPAPARPATDTSPPVPTRYADIKPVAESSDLTADSVTAVLISPDDTPTPEPDSYGDIAAQGGTGASGDIAARQPAIISRAGWGADESIRCRNATYDNSLAAAVVHHTAGSNNYTREASAGVVRGIYTYHARNLGWCDVGYNVLVDKYGQAFEGRHGGLNRNVQGAHAGGFNGNTWGISMMGDYSTVAPSDATVRKMGEIIGWRLSVAGVNPKGSDTHYSEGTSYTRYPAGAAVRLPNIFAHRDVGNTSCPGNAGYAKMGQIRDIAAAYAQSGGGTPAPTNPTPPVTNPGTTPRPGTGGTTIPGLTQGSVQDAVTSALRTVLSGGRLDAAELTRLLTGGKTLADIPFDAGSVQNAVGGDLGSVGDLLGGDFARLASQFSGPLGKVLSGVQRFGNVSLVKHENGALYSSPETGTHPVWGVIGDAWASQGFERGPLGLPVSSESDREDGTIAQRFEGGTLVFDPSTEELTVEPNP